MSEYTVHFSATENISVRVEADDYAEAMDKAYDELPGEVCGHCSGWNQRWTRDSGEPEAYEVVDRSTGKTVWSERTDEVSP